MQANSIAKRVLALILAGLSLLLAVSCAGEPKNDDTSSAAADLSSSGQKQEQEEKALVPFGVYYLVNDQGKKVGHKVASPSLSLDIEDEKNCRITPCTTVPALTARSITSFTTATTQRPI